jgi:CheY-like chemotaxis protein
MDAAMDSPAILVVDDDPDTREVVALALGLAGYTVSLAATGRDALDRITAQPPAVVLLDLAMPGMSGFEVLEVLRAEHPGIPVVFMTAGEWTRAEASRWQVPGYLPKPFDLDRLLDLVAGFLSPAPTPSAAGLLPLGDGTLRPR